MSHIKPRILSVMAFMAFLPLACASSAPKDDAFLEAGKKFEKVINEIPRSQNKKLRFKYSAAVNEKYAERIESAVNGDKTYSIAEAVRYLPPTYFELINAKNTASGINIIKSHPKYTFIPKDSAEYASAAEIESEYGKYKKIEFLDERDAGNSPMLANIMAVKTLLPSLGDAYSASILVDPSCDNVFFPRKDVLAAEGANCVSTELDDYGYFSYEYIGRLDNGIHVLETRKNEGGSLSDHDIIFVAFEEAHILAYGKTEKRTMIRFIGSHNMSYTAFSIMEIEGDALKIYKITRDIPGDYSSYFVSLKIISFE